MEAILGAVRCHYLSPSFLKDQMKNCDILRKVTIVLFILAACLCTRYFQFFKILRFLLVENIWPRFFRSYRCINRPVFHRGLLPPRASCTSWRDSRAGPSTCLKLLLLARTSGSLWRPYPSHDQDLEEPSFVRFPNPAIIINHSS